MNKEFSIKQVEYAPGVYAGMCFTSAILHPLFDNWGYTVLFWFLFMVMAFTDKPLKFIFSKEPFVLVGFVSISVTTIITPFIFYNIEVYPEIKLASDLIIGIGPVLLFLYIWKNHNSSKLEHYGWHCVTT